MKKKVLLVLSIISIVIGLYGEKEAKPNLGNIVDPKIYSEKMAVYKFDGFGFETYEPSKVGLEDIVRAEYEYIKEKTPEGDFSIFGHSQGGLRVLAFATYLQKHDPEMLKRLKTVVTVSGITQGIKALEGGLPATNAKIRRDLNILLDGVYGVATVFSIVDIMDSFGIFESEDVKAFVKKLLFMSLYDKHPDVKKWLEPALSATSAEKAEEILADMGEIRDMIPQSDFIKEFVIETTPYVYRVPIGTEKKLRWKKVTNKWGLKYWALRWHYTTIYGYKEASKKMAKFPKEVWTGYIVGTKNNTFSTFLSESGEKDVRDKFASAEKWFARARALHITKCVALYGLLVGSPKYAQDCRKARDYCRDIDGRINALLGENENDGLVVKSSQYIPKEDYEYKESVSGDKIDIDKNPYTVHENTIGTYTEFPFNHAEIINESTVKDKIKAMIDR